MEILHKIDTIHIVELVIIAFIIFRQFGLFIQSKSRIKRLKDLDLHTIEVVPVSLTIDEIRSCDDTFIANAVINSHSGTDIKDEITPSEGSTIVIPLLHSDNNISETIQIIKELNRYIVKNDGQSVNFHIIQDIVERNYQVLDDEINQTMPTPLYLGLAATMLGIIFGLVGMSLGDAETMSLIQGVGIAMISSFIGLTLTTFLSTYSYKHSKKEAEKEKNLFFSKLQAELLPDLIRQGVSGIDGLSRQLKSFAAVTKDSTRSLFQISEQTANTLSKQDALITRIDNMNFAKLSDASLTIFEKLERNLEAFERFSSHWEALTNSMKQTDSLLNNLEKLVAKISNVDNLADGIKSSIDDYRNTMVFFTKHIASFEELEDSAVKAVQKCDISVADAVDKLMENIHKRMESFDQHNTSIDIELKDAGSALQESVHKATQKQVELFTLAYANNTPAFENLKKLSNIEEAASDIALKIKEQNPLFNEELWLRFDKLEKATLQIADKVESLKNQSGIAENENLTNKSLGYEKPEKHLVKTKLEKVELVLRISAACVVIGVGAIYVFNLIF